MAYLALFFAGAFLCNAIPHLSAGLRGEPFPTPFARPHGFGESSPLTNFLWGTANLAIGLALGHVGVPNSLQLALLSFVAGWLALGVYLSLHFGKVRAGRWATSPYKKGHPVSRAALRDAPPQRSVSDTD